MAYWLDKAPTGDKNDVNNNFKSRTTRLADILKSHAENHPSKEEDGYLGVDSSKVNVVTAYLKEHPDILIYGFNKNGYLNEILVSPKWYSVYKDSINRKCTNSSDIVKILQKYTAYIYKHSVDLQNESNVAFIEVAMDDNVKDCRKNPDGGKSRRRLRPCRRSKSRPRTCRSKSRPRTCRSRRTCRRH